MTNPVRTLALVIGTHVGLLVFGAVNYANAATMTLTDCPTAFVVDGKAKVHDGPTAKGIQTATSKCEYLTPPDATILPSEDNVNKAGFFGVDTWDSMFKINIPKRVSGDIGAWAIPGAVDFTTYTYMLTFFRDGKNTNLVSFLLSGEYAAGRWSSPFTPSAFKVGKTQEVSQYALFRSAQRVSVPEPGR